MWRFRTRLYTRNTITTIATIHKRQTTTIATQRLNRTCLSKHNRTAMAINNNKWRSGLLVLLVLLLLLPLRDAAEEPSRALPAKKQGTLPTERNSLNNCAPRAPNELQTKPQRLW